LDVIQYAGYCYSYSYPNYLFSRETETKILTSAAASLSTQNHVLNFAKDLLPELRKDWISIIVQKFVLLYFHI